MLGFFPPEMAYMCTDSGNLMAIAQQVIQQKQQQQQQQQQQLHHQMAAANPFGMQPPWTSTTHHFHGFPFPEPSPPFAADPFQADGGELDLPSEVEMTGETRFRLSDFGSRDEFDSDEWMESLIGESVTESAEVVGETWNRGGVADGGCADEVPAHVHDAFVTCSPTTTGIEGLLVSGDHGLQPSLKQNQVRPWSSLPPLPPSPPAKDSGCQLSPLLPPISSDIPSPSLFQSLLDCARLADTDPDLAAKSLIRIRDASSPVGDPANRTAFYFSEALYYRLSYSSSSPQPPPIPDPSLDEFAVCYKTLNDACPYIKFSHFTANQAILESTQFAPKIHIVDFGVSEGVQLAALLQALATRTTGKPKKIKISGIPSPDLPRSPLSVTGNRLKDFAKLLDLDFEFIPVLTPLEELSPSSFNIDQDESVAVNFMLQLHLLLGKSSAPTSTVEQVLRLAKSLRPEVLTMGEFELGLNGIGFPELVANAFGFYSAIFDSLDQAMGRESQERASVERLLLGRQILCAVGIGGRRLRMEDKSNWTALMEKCRFEPIHLGQFAMSQANILLWNYNYSSRYCLVESSPAFLSLGWDDRPLLTVSAWK